MKKIKRRNFIQSSIILSSLFGFKSSLWEQNIISSGLSEQQWRTVVDYARWCPTVHNLQPHRIKITSPTTAEIYIDTKRKLLFGDPHSIFLRVALGVFIEHLSIATSAYGKGIEVARITDTAIYQKEGLAYFADLKLVSSAYGKDIDRAFILQRRTSRVPYEKETVSTGTLQKVNQEAQQFHHNFDWSSDPDFVDRFMRINQKALFDDLENDNIRTELDHLFRYNQKSAEAKKDGLSAKCMDFSGALLRSVFQKYEKWKKPFRRKLLSKTYLSKFKGTQTLGWFTGEFETTEDFVKAGRMFARTWLRITEDGCYIQPFGSLITNEKAYAQINETLQTKPAKRKIWMIFRVGYSKEPARSERLDLDTILL